MKHGVKKNPKLLIFPRAVSSLVANLIITFAVLICHRCREDIADEDPTGAAAVKLNSFTREHPLTAVPFIVAVEISTTTP